MVSDNKKLGEHRLVLIHQFRYVARQQIAATPTTTLLLAALFSVLRVHFARVSSPNPEYAYVNGSRRFWRSCGSDEIPWKPPDPQWILTSDFPTNAQWPLCRNRFALLPWFGSYANLFLPIENIVSNAEVYANSSSIWQRVLSRIAFFFL